MRRDFRVREREASRQIHERTAVRDERACMVEHAAMSAADLSQERASDEENRARNAQRGSTTRWTRRWAGESRPDAGQQTGSAAPRGAGSVVTRADVFASDLAMRIRLQWKA